MTKVAEPTDHRPSHRFNVPLKKRFTKNVIENIVLSLIHTMHVRLRQIATLRQWDVVSNVENGYRTHSLHLRQIANKYAKKKTHSVDGPLVLLSLVPKLA